EAGGDRLQATRNRLSDEAELRYRQRFEPDLVADEMNGRGAEHGGHLGPDGDQRRAHDGEGRLIREPPTADEPDRDPTGLQLRGDLRPGAVHDDDLVAGGVTLPHDPERVGCHATTELDHDTSHVVYSALSFTWSYGRSD